MRDENWYPSLAIFQFLLWTGVVLFGYLGVSLARLFSGLSVFTDIPTNLLIVMGISAGTTIIGAATSRIKYDGTTPPDVPPTKSVPSYAIRMRLPGFKTMLMENGKITLPRLQMFAWTWIGIAAYLATLFVVVVASLTDFEFFRLPELPLLLVELMGLGSVTYIAAKSTRAGFISINEVKPRRGRLQQTNNSITILGSHFGNKGNVWIEYYPPLNPKEKKLYCRPFETLSQKEKKLYRRPLSRNEKNEMTREELEAYEKGCAEIYEKDCIRLNMIEPNRMAEQINVTPNIVTRDENRIEVSLDKIRDKLKKTGVYVVRVEKDGILTYVTSDATFWID